VTSSPGGISISRAESAKACADTESAARTTAKVVRTVTVFSIAGIPGVSNFLWCYVRDERRRIFLQRRAATPEPLNEQRPHGWRERACAGMAQPNAS